MGHTQQKRQERQIFFAYLLMLISIFTILPLLLTYWLAAKFSHLSSIEAWLNSHTLWITGTLLIFVCIVVFAVLWFIPLAFFVWDQYIWVTACTVTGVIFTIIAWLYLINAWLKGITRFFQRKPVY